MLKKLIISVALVFVITPSWAWQPSGPIHVVTGQTAGSGNEVVMRGIADIIEKNNPGVAFVFEGHAGADGVNGVNYFSSQRPDGLTVLSNGIEAVAVAMPTFHRSQLRISTDQLVPVTMLANSPLAFFVAASSPIHTPKDLIAYLKTHDHVTIGANAAGNVLAIRYLMDKLKVDRSKIQIINYNNPTSMLIDVASADVNIGTGSISVIKSLAGTKIRIVAHTGDQPVPGAESVPAINQLVPGYNIGLHWSLFLPPGADQDIVDWYVEQITRALNTTHARAYFYTRSINIERDLGSRAMAHKINALKKQLQPIADQIQKENQ
jgi:tripartite-type tricarboxylate transporter receptor subunit TctC